MSTAAVQLVRTEARLFLREPLAVFWIIVFPTVLLVVLGLVPPFREDDPALGGQSVIDLYVPVVVLLAMIVSGAQVLPEAIIGYRQRRVLRRLRTTPVSPRLLLQAHLLVHAAAVVVATVLCLGVGRLAYGVALPQAPVAYVVTLLVALAATLAVGALITALSPTAAVGNVVGMAVMFASMFTAGVWVPVQAMPDLLRHIAELTPMGASAQALNQAALGGFPDAWLLAVTGVWAVLLGAIALRTFRWE